MEGDDEYPLGDPLAQLMGGGSWEADAGIWTDAELLAFGNELIHGDDQHDQTGGAGAEDDSSGTEQLTADSSETNHVQLDADLSGLDYLLLQTEEMNDASWEQRGHEPSPPVPAPAPARATIQAADHEMEIAEMVRVAEECGEDDDARTVWSEEEHKQLLHCLQLYAEYDAVIRCFKIAFHLPKKTTSDVALRCRWLQDKKNAAGKAELARKNKDAGKVNKVKGTKGAKTSNKIYPLSKEALNSKSTRELIRDNNMFLKRLEENLKTGQLENTADYFYYVKTNMDAIEKRVRELGISIVMPPIDEQGLEEILRSGHLNPSAQIENS